MPQHMGCCGKDTSCRAHRLTAPARPRLDAGSKRGVSPLSRHAHANMRAAGTVSIGSGVAGEDQGMEVATVASRHTDGRRTPTGRCDARTICADAPSNTGDYCDMKTMMAAALRAALATTTILGSAAALIGPRERRRPRPPRSAARSAMRPARRSPARPWSRSTTGTNQTFRATTDANGSYIAQRSAPGAPTRSPSPAPTATISRSGIVGRRRPVRDARRDAGTLRRRAPPTPTAPITGGANDGERHRRHRQPAGRDQDQRSRDQRQPARRSATLPQTDRNFLTLRRARAGRALQRQRNRQGHPVGRVDREPGQRVHRRRQPEEQDCARAASPASRTAAATRSASSRCRNSAS